MRIAYCYRMAKPYIDQHTLRSLATATTKAVWVLPMVIYRLA